MNARSYFDAVSSISGAKRAASRFANVLGGEDVTALVPAKARPTFAEYMSKAKEGAPSDVRDTAGTAIGAAAGAILPRNHRVLGFVGGASLGRNVPALISAGHRRDALCNMGQTGAAVAGSLLLSGAPIAGFALGYLAGGAAIYFGGFRK